MNLYFNADSETNNIYTKCNDELCRPPLGDFRYWSLDVLPSDMLVSLVALAFGVSSPCLSSSDLPSLDLSSSDWSSSGLTSSEGIHTGLSSLAGTGTGMMDRLEI